MASSTPFWLKLVKLLIALLILVPACALAFIWYVGAWNVVFPSSAHDVEPPLINPSLGSPAVLVFSKTNGFRHEEGIKGGQRALSDIAHSRGWSVFATENGAVFTSETLNRFDAVVFLNATGDMLSAPQEQAFEAWLTNGGGWLGIHAAGDGSHMGWDWYNDTLIGARFTAHIMGPQFQTASVLSEGGDHPVVTRLPAIWDHEEEWYSWAASPRAKGFTILATLNEDSYTPVQNFMGQSNDLRMGDHPVVWSNCVGQGKSVYSAMGHKAAAFENPHVQTLLEDALAWLIAGQPCE